MREGKICSVVGVGLFEFWDEKNEGRFIVGMERVWGEWRDEGEGGGGGILVGVNMENNMGVNGDDLRGVGCGLGKGGG